ncbi:membrane bound lytic murein transglycosylase [Legionella birminghamensis]|uniref:Membrane bound lytic murein transglycosylase n=1 Tax=Legionella birminghamensis TaxID=28083 RepID=A0A378I8A1_9GAMM|nr:lytic murein transglycosylase B [Legionella birminghamensis]KTC68282.1 membrane bound lytic murein transglycosylase [Legionella birminghamensis]STX31005.1 membrane bound lytic murein transglycosylase [Legionella birminghamensis]
MRRLIAIGFAFFSIIYSSLSFSDASFTQRKDVQAFVEMMVKKHNFDRIELLAVMSDVKLQPQIIESMEKPYEKKNWDVYKQLFLTPQRVEGGIDFWRKNQEALSKAEQKYHVPANIIVAIIGIETLYGKNQGNYRVLDALSTLAFNYPKRSEFFSKELGEYLLLCREHHVSPTQYMGSYAGAMGKPQFMPSSYRYYAADFTGNPKKDLMNDDDAVIASVANYFNKHGWNLNQGIAQPAQISGTGYKRINTSYKTAAYSISQLRAAGIKPVTASFNVPKKAGLIELTTDTGPEYWLAYPNFYVITRYNSSPQYALAVYLLAQQLKNQWAQATASKQYAYA